MSESITRRRVLLGGAIGATSALVAGCASTPDDDGHGMTSDCWRFDDAWPEKVTTKPGAGYNRVARALFKLADMDWNENQNNTNEPAHAWLWEKLYDDTWDLSVVGNGPTDKFPAETTAAYAKYQDMWTKARKHVMLWLDLAKNPACYWQVCCPTSPGSSDVLVKEEKKAIGDATLPPPPPP